MKCSDFTIYDMIAGNAVRHSDRDAIVCGERRTTFGTYRTLCDRYAAGLVHEGVSMGDRMAVISGNGDDFLVLLGAAAKIGVIVVPVNWRLNEDEITYILQDTQPTHLFSSRECLDPAEKASARVRSIRKHYLFGADGREGKFLPFETLRREEGCEEAGAASGHSPFLIIHTAATGGKPRGSVLSQANLVAAGLQIAHLLKLDGRDAHICILPLFHIGGLSMTFATMHPGGKTVIVDHFDPRTVLKLIEKERGTFFAAFPPILASVLDVQGKESFDTASLRIVGGMDRPETIESFLKTNPQASFYSIYGQTEAMPVSGVAHAERPGSIGLPAILTRVALFDDLDREVPPGATGEICVRSPAVFQGYWNLAEDKACTFRNGWHHTGDLGRGDIDGFLWYVGRKPEKELIKSGGENVYPAEVEKAILSHGSIEDVCVIGVPDPEWGEAIKAVCVLKKDHFVSAAELTDFVAARIARYKKPRCVVFVDSLPRTLDGAVDREAVKRIPA
jgi:acyl-CoA synthetase (AMP-forming)/AMP-acid ligase II